MVKSLDLYIQLLEQTPKKNLLVKACRLYVSCEYVVCALKCLAFFTYKIGMPFLNMCELSSQKDMKTLLPRFYHELVDGNMNCLKDFHVEWNRIKIDEPKSALAKYMIGKMCYCRRRFEGSARSRIWLLWQRISQVDVQTDSSSLDSR